MGSEKKKEISHRKQGKAKDEDEEEGTEDEGERSEKGGKEKVTTSKDVPPLTISQASVFLAQPPSSATILQANSTTKPRPALPVRAWIVENQKFVSVNILLPQKVLSLNNLGMSAIALCYSAPPSFAVVKKLGANEALPSWRWHFLHSSYLVYPYTTHSRHAQAIYHTSGGLHTV